MNRTVEYKTFINMLNTRRKGLGDQLDERICYCKINKLDFSLGEDLVYLFEQTYELKSMQRLNNNKTAGEYYIVIGIRDRDGDCVSCRVGTMTEYKERYFNILDGLDY